MAEFGSFCLILALSLTVAQAGFSGWGRLRRSPLLVGAGQGAAVAAAVALALAFAVLLLAFWTSDFSLKVVAANSHTDKPAFYKIAGAWGNHEGSLLLWCLVMAAFGAVLAGARGLNFGLKASAVATQGALTALFVGFAVFTSSPFTRLTPAPIQGASLNPLLQDPALAFHPPLLYGGYVGLSVCFSLAVAALIEGRAGSAIWPAWGRWVRPWALASWALLTVGITLGSFWAYYELGWGGWWFWDPVENASFMPWLAAAALLHSAVVTERRGALAGWTTFLALLAFTFSMLGAFLVRSGVLTSVHAFAVDPERGMALLGILAVASGAAFALFAWRVPKLSPGGSFAPVSREAGLVLNNLFLTVAAVTVLLGTLYPLIFEAFTGETISVGPPYFALTFTPLMTVAALILPAGPMLAWKRGDLRGVGQRLMLAAGLSVAVGLGALALWSPGKALTALGVAIAAWLMLGALSELADRLRLFRAPAAETGRRARALPLSAWGMTLAHFGVGLFVLGAAVEIGLKSEAGAVIPIGGEVASGPFRARLEAVQVIEGPNYLAEQARVVVTTADGGAPRIVTAERRFFPAGGQTTTEVGLDFRGLDDVYLVLGERAATAEGERAWSLRIAYHPFARLIFLGPMIMALGGLLSLMDRRLRVAPSVRARREVRA